MNDKELLELAKECVLYECSSEWYVGCEEELEAFYRAAFNAGLEAAAKVCEAQIETGAHLRCAAAIRRIEVKP